MRKRSHLLLIGHVADRAVGEELHDDERVLLLNERVGAVEAADVGVPNDAGE